MYGNMEVIIAVNLIVVVCAFLIFNYRLRSKKLKKLKREIRAEINQYH